MGSVGFVGEGREDHEDRDLVEALDELSANVAKLVDLLSNPIVVEIVEAQNGTPTTIVLVPGTPRSN